MLQNDGKIRISIYKQQKNVYKKISLKWIISFLNCLAFFKEMKWMNKYKNKKIKTSYISSSSKN